EVAAIRPGHGPFDARVAVDQDEVNTGGTRRPYAEACGPVRTAVRTAAASLSVRHVWLPSILVCRAGGRQLPDLHVVGQIRSVRPFWAGGEPETANAVPSFGAASLRTTHDGEDSAIPSSRASGHVASPLVLCRYGFWCSPHEWLHAPVRQAPPQPFERP